MKQLAIANEDTYDLNGAGLPGAMIKLDGDSLSWTDSGIAHWMVVFLEIGSTSNALSGTGNLTITPKIGLGSLSVRSLISHVKTCVIDATRVKWSTDPFPLTANQNFLKFYVYSDNVNDVEVSVIATLIEVASFDSNGRVDVGKMLGTAVTLGGAGSDKLDVNVNDWNDVTAKSSASDYPQVDVVSVGDETPTTLTDIKNAVNSAVSHITSGTAAINTTAISSPDGFVITKGTNEVNNEDSTHEENETFHSLEDDSGDTDAYYIFNVGGNGVPVSIIWIGYAQSNNDSYDVYAYNFNATTWEQIGTIAGQNGTDTIARTFWLTNAQVGSGENLGKVYFRFVSSNGTKFATDRVLCSYSIVTTSVGYANGSVWVDTNLSNTNTESYVDGTADNPVSTWAAALTIAGNMNMKNFNLINGSSVTMTGSCDNYTFLGSDYNLALGGQSFENTHIQDGHISGTGTSGSGELHIINSSIGDCTLGKFQFRNCGLEGTITIGSADYSVMDSCFAADDSGNPPEIDFDDNAATVCLRNYNGGIKIKNMAAGSKFTIQGNGKVTIDSTCDSGGTIGINGNITKTDNVSGGFSGTLTEDARIDVTQIENAVWDATASDHTNSNYFGGYTNDILGYTAVTDAIIQSMPNLKYLVDHAVDPTRVADNSIIAKMVSKGATADWDDFVNTTDSLQAIHDAQLTATNVSSAVNSVLNTAIPGSPTANSINERIKAIDDKLPSADYLSGTSESDGGFCDADKADINEQCDTALTDYDGPTNAEMEARTLPSDNYFDPTTDTVAKVTLVETTTTNTDMRGTDSAVLAASARAWVGEIEGASFATGTDSLQAIRDRGDDAWMGSVAYIGETSAASVVSDSVFTIHSFDGISTQNGFYDDALILVRDKDDTDRIAIRRISNYDSSKQITVDAAIPFPSGLGVGDTVQILQTGYAGVGVTGGDATAANQLLMMGAGYSSASHSLKQIKESLSGAAGAPSLE